MAIKLTRIKTKAPKNKYKVVVKVMHGDADFYEEFSIDCKDDKEFTKIMTSVKNQPLDGSAGGNEEVYAKWCEDNFGEGTIPYDRKYSGTGNLAKVESVEGFYYDANGVKFEAEVTD